MWTRFTRCGRVALPLLLLGALAVACGDDNGGGTGPTLDDLVGTWDASSASLTDNATSASVDLVQLGLTVELEITALERFTFTVRLGATVVEQVMGDFTINGNNFTLTDDDDPNDPISGTFTLQGDNLSVEADDVELFDFNMDGTNDPARLEADFDRVT